MRVNTCDFVHIRRGRVQSDATRLKDIIANIVYDTQAKTTPKAKQYKDYTTGFSELDECLTGLNRSDLIIIGARPAMGKTSVALRLARNIAMHAQKRVLFFTLEMTKAQVAQRVLSMEALVPGYKIRNGSFDLGEKKKIADAVSSLNDCDLWFDDTPALTVRGIKARTRQLKGVDCVVIDYLGLLQSDKRTENRVQEVREITRCLKLMAKDLNIPVVCCAQLSRATEDRGKSHRPQLNDLRNSEDADVVMLLYREEPEANTMEIIVAKNRHGVTKTIEFVWDGEHTLILPRADGGDHSEHIL